VLKLNAKIAFIILLGLMPLFGVTTLAQDALSPRLQIGINLLPAVIAADKSLIADDSSKNLRVQLLYRENTFLAQQLASRLEQVGTIRKHKLEIVPVTFNQLLASEAQQFDVIFVVEPVGNRLQDLIEFAQQRRTLLFSPFEGDVELGVTAGFQVTDKVLPLVNMASLKLSKIQLKAFFLRIAVKHE
jgi:hypothetical protein